MVGLLPFDFGSEKVSEYVVTYCVHEKLFSCQIWRREDPVRTVSYMYETRVHMSHTPVWPRHTFYGGSYLDIGGRCQPLFSSDTQVTRLTSRTAVLRTKAWPDNRHRCMMYGRHGPTSHTGNIAGFRKGQIWRAEEPLISFCARDEGCIRMSEDAFRPA